MFGSKKKDKQKKVKVSDEESRAQVKAAREAAERGDIPGAKEDAETEAHLASVAAGGKKRSERLGSVLSESVPAAALARIRGNSKFLLRDETGDASLGMMLYAAGIGGLDAHSARSDPDKGQFIELVNGQKIHVYASEDLMAEDKFLIIPDDETLDALSEFAFLSDPERFSGFVPTLVSWDDAGEMTLDEYPGAPRNYDWFLRISQGSLSLLDACVECGVYDEGAVSESDDGRLNFGAGDGVEAGYDDMPEDEPGIDTDPGLPQEEYDDGAGSVVAPATTATADGLSRRSDQIRCPRCGHWCDASGCDDCGWTPGGEDAGEDADTEEEYGREVTEELSSCVFYQNDLDLRVTTAPFDMVFLSRDDFVPLDDVRGSGLVAEHATQVIRNANEELRALHQGNIDTLRRRFLTVMGKKCADISVALDMSTEAPTKYGAARREAEQGKIDRAAAILQEVEKRRAEMREGWEKEKAQAGEAAAAKARQDYEDRSRRAHNEALTRLRSDAEDRNQAEYDKDIREISDRRKIEAISLMNRYTQETMDQLRQDYEEMLRGEKALRDERLAEIRAYVNENMAFEDARTQSLNRQLDDNARADAVRREMEQALAKKDMEQRLAVTALEAKVSEANATTATVRENYDERLAEAQRHAADAEAQLSELLDKYTNQREEIQNEIHEQYRTRIETLTNDKLAAQEHLVHTEKMYESAEYARRRNSRLHTAAWCAGLAAAICAGFVLGGLLYPVRPMAEGGGPVAGGASISQPAPEEAFREAPSASVPKAESPEPRSEENEHGDEEDEVKTPAEPADSGNGSSSDKTGET